MITPGQLREYLKASPNFRWYKALISSDGKYFAAFKHIYDNKPKLTLEYGGGRSTHTLQLFINELNYGGRIVGFEETQEFYDHHVEIGANEFNNIVKVEGKVEGKFFTYIHDMEPYKDVDFIILDGPDFRTYRDAVGVTTNLKDFVDLLGKEIPYFIDGRQGDVKYYGTTLGYTVEVVDVKGKDNKTYTLK